MWWKMEEMFVGEYKYNLEEKGRLFIPVEFRRELAPDAQNTFVATQGQDECIAVYPLNIWKEVIEKELLNYPQDTPEQRWLVRHFTKPAKYLKIDSQGRINIPQRLSEYAKLNKEVMIVGALRRIELWHPDNYISGETEFTPSKPGIFPNLKL
ncbi:MAG: division/cell wall cluster transcriptional repressor MraZ [Candidatus Stahlbacteria bacterium]|nr:division/cell wall cluster transcriptional repressor MraZ [Candidatus Stahlbacteria bacterium]